MVRVPVDSKRNDTKEGKITKSKAGKREKRAVRRESNEGGTTSGSWYQKKFQGRVST